MQNQTPNLERYILAELQGMSAADTYIVSSDIWVDCINSHKIVHVFKKSDNTLVTTLYVNIETGAVSSTAPTGSITVTECNSDTKTSFQIIDCSGANVGTPLSVEQTIVVNKVLTSICNVSEIFQPIVDELHNHIEPLLQELIDQQDIENNMTAPVSICVDNAGVKTTHLVRQNIKFDSETNTTTSTIVEYSVDGITWSTTVPTGTISLGVCVVADNSKITYQPVDCAGANVGSPVEASNVKLVNASEIYCAIVTAIDSAKTAIVDAVNNANTDITAAIEASTAVLEEIKTELVTANTTLTNIKTDTTSINTKLDTVITKIDTMITSLSSIDTKLTTTNTTLADILLELQGLGADLADIKVAVESIDLKLDDVITSLTSIETKLDTLHTDLVGIKDTLDDILAQLDHELIITNPTVNCATDGDTKVSFYTREKIVWDSESGTEISKTIEYSLDGEDFTATKPAGIITIGACVTTGDISASLVEFQLKDCDNNNIGDPIESLPVMVVNKTTTSICNTDDITEPIVEAIEAKEELDTVVDTIQVCGYNQDEDSYAKYLIRTTTSINNKTGVKTEVVEYTTNGKDWVTTEPVDDNSDPILFTIGDCAPVQLPEPCYENKSYEVGTSKAIVFAANTLFKYGGAFFNGGGGMIEGNNIDNFISHEEGDRFGNGFGSLLKTLPNQVTVYTDSTGNAKISVMQVCGASPQILDAVSGVIVTQATAKYPEETIDVTWNDVENETSYDIYRYETVDGVSTAVKIGSVAAGVTTYNDATALPNVNYTYYVVGVNSVSQSISSKAEVAIDKITGSLTLSWNGTGYDSNDDFSMNAIYNA